MACSWDIHSNISKAEKLVIKAANAGANIVLLQELFETPYFCIEQNDKHFGLAKEYPNELIYYFSELAKKLNVVLPISYFEKSNTVFFNSLCVIDANGEILENYRKSHIPNGPGYQEKTYFSPGDTGFKVWNTLYGKIGVGICWDQWFPEAARSMTLQGAEILFYPTAIGSEPHDQSIDSKDHWQRTMQGHSAANIIPIVASNRIGKERVNDTQIDFYGSSFITNETGATLQQADRSSESILLENFDLNEISQKRNEWNLFRDRRPDLYQNLLTLDGES
ncbi:N-carbamoylputrescine amidase [Marinibactrum halimedae]|uniref:N-carbamoylputrescine amidase n=2 Tax=Marinibactrum halimedae TaxID=1444977 RepID=A0AA37T5W2_9GAMM|nr:N-carbamoylputrescine amidase [Marinibactrum halimedae]